MRRPKTDPDVQAVVNGQPITFARSTVDDLPDAPGFVGDLLAKRVSLPIAREYARLVAKLKREGRLGAPNLVEQRTSRTAANAYWRWVSEAYTLRVSPVLRAFTRDDFVRRGHMWIRVHSIVGPVEGKCIPQQRIGYATLDGATKEVHVHVPAGIEWVPSSAWTLHVPRKPMPPHQDPCAECAPIELDAKGEQLEVLAAAFESAWGHRDLSRMPGEALLFGAPPREDVAVVERTVTPSGRIVALVPPGQLANDVERMGGSVVRELAMFAARVQEVPVPDAIMISRSAIAGKLDEVLALVREAWK